MKKTYFAAACLLLNGIANGQISINEIFAKNNLLVYNPQTAGYTDYIELFNAGADAVNIGGYMLSDSPQQPDKWKFPEGTSIDAGKALIVWADGGNTGMHTSFKLSNQGETVRLSNATGNKLDEIRFPLQVENRSYGRKPDGSGAWQFLSQPTPAKPNTSAPLSQPPVCPASSLAAGFYASAQTLSLSSPSGATIYYTTDGSEPTSASAIYLQEISISKTTIVRAVCINDKGTSEILTCSIFIGERTFDLPIVSLSTDDKNFFSDETGIYVKGTNGIAGRCMDEPVNWNQEWERPVSFEYFTPAGKLILQKDADTRIMGGCSRTMAQKSLTIVARSGKFDYPFFAERKASSYKSIILRNSGNDWGGKDKNGNWLPGTMMRDAFLQKLVKDQMDIDMQDYQPVAVFINGKYWGLHNMQEHLNEDYIANIHPEVNEDNIDLIKNYWDIKDGDDVALKELLNYAETVKFEGPDGFDRANEYIDVNEYINYQMSEIYFSNYDWPGNNIRFFRERTAGGRWRFILFDTDISYGIWGYLPTVNDLAAALSPNGPEWPNPPQSTLLFRKLMDNDTFRNLFIQRFAVQLNNAFAPERVNTLLDKMRDSIDLEMHYHLKRWYATFNSIEEWRARVDDMKTWGAARQIAMMDIIQNFYKLGTPVKLQTRTADTKLVSITVAGAKLNNANSELKCFPGIPVTIQATPADGYLFNHWETADGTIVSSNSRYTFTPDTDISLKAVIGSRPAVANIYINEIVASNKSLVSNEAGNTPDYVELVNNGTVTADLSGLYITDDLANLQKYVLPHDNQALSIAPGEHLVLWADGRPELGSRHIGWKISKSGGIIVLSRIDAGNASIIDDIKFGAIADNYSFGRFPSGAAPLMNMVPTPSAENVKPSSTASLLSLDMPPLPMTPQVFHPDSLRYTIGIPEGFDPNVKLSGLAYCNGTVTVSPLDMQTNTITVTVVSEDKTAVRVYTFFIKDYIAVSNKLASINVGNGTLVGDFSPEIANYTIISDNINAPEITWQPVSPEATVKYTPVTGPEGLATITVTSPTFGARTYKFAVTASEPVKTGLTINFDGTENVSEDAASYSTSFSGGILTVAVDKTGTYESVNIGLDETIDVSKYPYIQIGISSDVALNLRIDYVDENWRTTNGNAQSKTIKTGAQTDYLYSYNGAFYQLYPDYQDVDATKIKNLWICFNPGETGLVASAKIDYIKLGSDVSMAVPVTGETVVPKAFISNGTLIPAFSPMVTNYQIIDYTDLPKLFAVASSDNASIITKQIDQATGKGSFTIKVTGQPDRTYTFTLRPDGLSSDASLKTLRSLKTPLAEKFDPNLLEYSINETSSVASNLSATANGLNAKVRIVPAPTSYQNSYVIVTSEDGTVQIYTVYHYYEAPIIIDATIEKPISANIIYPNPAIDQFSFAGESAADVTLFTTTGAVLHKWTNAQPAEPLYIGQTAQAAVFVRIINASGEYWELLTLLH